VHDYVSCSMSNESLFYGSRQGTLTWMMRLCFRTKDLSNRGKETPRADRCSIGKDEF